MKGFFNVPIPKNEPVLSYGAGSPERKALQEAIAEARNQVLDIPMYIGGERVRSEKKTRLAPPYDHQHTIAHYHAGDASHVHQAVTAAMNARKEWANMSWEHRAAIFLKAAELIAGPYRYKMNAATILGQSKNAHQAEIDCVCELVDFLRFNVAFMTQIYSQQPESTNLSWNRSEYRPLEGFVFALTPFNFTAIAGNLPTAPAMMGNVVVWKPSNTQIYSAQLIMEILMEAGLPAGVINLVYVGGAVIGDVVLNHSDFAGIHFTGSTGVFNQLWGTIGNNIAMYKTYPRIVGETGGKDFVLAHPTANVKQVVANLIRGSFEFQGQKCSAASRAYIPSNLWAETKALLQQEMATVTMGSPEEFHFVNAVIDEKSFDNIVGYIEDARKTQGIEIMCGGKYDKSKGYFVEPTIIVTENPTSRTMVEEIFGPVLTIYVYQAENFEDTLTLVDETSPYALTGAIFAQDRYAIELATQRLSHAAGNFYINDKPTGAVVGQQPFGGGRSSGTNDKAGSLLNLMRWVSARTIKETFVTATDYRYPFLEK